MSLDKPPIDDLLKMTGQNPFLLSTIAAKRAKDINDMMQGQRKRAIALDTAAMVAKGVETTPLNIALKEIENGDISYVKESEKKLARKDNKSKHPGKVIHTADL